MNFTARNEERREGGAVLHALSYLPPSLKKEILSVGASYKNFSDTCTELRINAGGVSTLYIGGIRCPLFATVTKEQTREIVVGLSDGALYAYRENIAEGYLAIGRGVRVGISGTARYEGEKIRGVYDIRSIVFRFPTGRCDFLDELYAYWHELGDGGLLVISPPAGGKTSALRAMCKRLGKGRDARRVVVVDERGEFDGSEFGDTSVDILQGYRRCDGIELAMRTLSPEVIAVDEILTDGDAVALELAFGVGVALLATAHAEDHRSAMKRSYIKKLIDAGAFRGVVTLAKDGGRYFIKEKTLC